MLFTTLPWTIVQRLPSNTIALATTASRALSCALRHRRDSSHYDEGVHVRIATRTVLPIVVALGLAMSAPGIATAAAPPPTASNTSHVQAGCGETLTLHTPATADGVLTPAAVGAPADDPILARAASSHAHWLAQVSCQARPDIVHAPITNAGFAQSLNWSGFLADPTPYTTPNYVQANWTEPSVSYPSGETQPYALSSIWPGLGGDSSGTTLVQDGTSQQVTSSGTQTHFFWFEVVPGEYEQQVTNLVPSVGDSVATDVYWASGTATFTFCDFTKNQCVSGSQSSSAPSNSAEWIVERPELASGGYSSYHFAALPNFSKVNFTGSGYEESPTGSLVYNVSSGGGTAVTMVNDSGQELAAPGSLTGGGTGFPDYWQQSH